MRLSSNPISRELSQRRGERSRCWKTSRNVLTERTAQKLGYQFSSNKKEKREPGQGTLKEHRVEERPMSRGPHVRWDLLLPTYSFQVIHEGCRAPPMWAMDMSDPPDEHESGHWRQGLTQFMHIRYLLELTTSLCSTASLQPYWFIACCCIVVNKLAPLKYSSLPRNVQQIERSGSHWTATTD